jgi:DNA-binding transcriptional MerR regulator
MMGIVRIGELAAASGQSARTIRFYEARGLLPEPTRSTNGYRAYTDADADRLEFIRNAQSAGLTLNEIASIIQLRDGGTTPCGHVAALLDAKLADLQQHLDQLSELRSELQALVRRARTLDPQDCTTDDICHILRPIPPT